MPDDTPMPPTKGWCFARWQEALPQDGWDVVWVEDGLVYWVKGGPDAISSTHPAIIWGPAIEEPPTTDR